MGTTWNESWTEVWSAGHGRSRSYCGIARTEDGFAVDVFHGDTCVASSTYESWDEAERAAHLTRSAVEVPGSGFRVPGSVLSSEPDQVVVSVIG